MCTCKSWRIIFTLLTLFRVGDSFHPVVPPSSNKKNTGSLLCVWQGTKLPCRVLCKHLRRCIPIWSTNFRPQSNVSSITLVGPRSRSSPPLLNLWQQRRLVMLHSCYRVSTPSRFSPLSVRPNLTKARAKKNFFVLASRHHETVFLNFVTRR